jgi:hypothetical protein
VCKKDAVVLVTVLCRIKFKRPAQMRIAIVVMQVTLLTLCDTSHYLKLLAGVAFDSSEVVDELVSCVHC